MGVLNVTPDSFSDGGRFIARDAAIAHAREMVAAGAAIVDVGGESTRPGAEPVPVQAEMDRVLPVIEALAAEVDALISVDTSKPEVMSAACEAGAHLINDVFALRRDGALEAAAATGAGICLMHMQGEPGTMQTAPRYDDVVTEVADFLHERAAAARDAGVGEDAILLDPGFGFGKTLEHNLRLLARLSRFTEGPYPVMVGMSRKSMFAKLLDREVDERLPASIAAASLAAWQGVTVIRAHDVAETVDAVAVAVAARRAGGTSTATA